MKKKDYPKILKHKSKYSNFDELKEHLTHAPDEKITMCMDKLLLKGGRISEIGYEIEKHNKRLGSNDFHEPERIWTHIRFRESHDDWIFEQSGPYSDPFVRLIGRQGEI